MGRGKANNWDLIFSSSFLDPISRHDVPGARGCSVCDSIWIITSGSRPCQLGIRKLRFSTLFPSQSGRAHFQGINILRRIWDVHSWDSYGQGCHVPLFRSLNKGTQRKSKGGGWRFAVTPCVRIKTVVTKSLPLPPREEWGAWWSPLNVGQPYSGWQRSGNKPMLEFQITPTTSASRTWLFITCLSKLAISWNNPQMPPFLSFTTNIITPRTQT